METALATKEGNVYVLAQGQGVWEVAVGQKKGRCQGGGVLHSRQGVWGGAEGHFGLSTGYGNKRGQNRVEKALPPASKGKSCWLFLPPSHIYHWQDLCCQSCELWPPRFLTRSSRGLVGWQEVAVCMPRRGQRDRGLHCQDRGEGGGGGGDRPADNDDSYIESNGPTRVLAHHQGRAEPPQVPRMGLDTVLVAHSLSLG